MMDYAFTVPTNQNAVKILQSVLWGNKKPLYVAFADFHVVNTFIMACVLYKMLQRDACV